MLTSGARQPFPSGVVNIEQYPRQERETCLPPSRPLRHRGLPVHCPPPCPTDQLTSPCCGPSAYVISHVTSPQAISRCSRRDLKCAVSKEEKEPGEVALQATEKNGGVLALGLCRYPPACVAFSCAVLCLFTCFIMKSHNQVPKTH